MKAKTIGLFALSIFALVFLMSAVSAATLAEWPLTSDGTAINVLANVNAGNFLFGSTLTNTNFNATVGATATGWNTVALGANDYYEITLSPNSGFDLTINSISFDQVSSNATTNMSFDVKWSNDGFTSSNNIAVGKVSTITSTPFSETVNIAISNDRTFTLRIFGYNSDDSATETFSVENLIVEGTVTQILLETSICAFDGGVSTNDGELKVDIRDITVIDGFGKDEEWLLLDEVEVEIRVENNGDYDVDDISLEWGIANDDLTDWAVDFDEIDEFDLKDGDEDTFTITFKIDDDDLDNLDFDEISGLNYNLVVRATGVVDDEDNLFIVDDTCAADFDEISVQDESNFVILNNIQIPEVVQCDADVQITADVWNIGDRDQDEVYVLVKSDALGINNEKIEIGDIDKFDNAPFNFDFQVPSDAEEKTYSIRFTVYDDDNDVYENDYDEDESIFSVFLKVEGNCAVDSEVLISASLESEAKAGKEMIMSVLLTNTADVTRSFTMEASGYDAWAELSEFPRPLTINADSVGEALFKFDIKKGISGEQTFLVMVYSDNKLIATQPVSVNVESARPFLGITGLVTTDNAYLWGIGLLNIILIIIIILIAVRIARRK